MKVAQCSNKHFYDADKFKTCPHCNPNAEKREQITPDIKSETPNAESSLNGKKELPSKEQNNPAEKTWGVYNDLEVISVSDSNNQSEKNNESLDDVTDLDYKPNQKESEVSDLSAADKSSQAYADEPRPTTDSKTVAYYNTGTIEPVTGWLVCIKGESIGASYNLKVGKNTIGRSISMNVALTEEPSVSREKHAIITFDPKNTKFYIQAGETDNLSYLNDEILMTVAELKAFDKIQLGAAEFVFVPFCSEKFSWNDYITD